MDWSLPRVPRKNVIRGKNGPISCRERLHWKRELNREFSADAFENLAAFQVGVANAHLGVRRAGSPAPVATANGEYVSGNFFETFGVSAWRGRVFTEADDREGTPPVAGGGFHHRPGRYRSESSGVAETA